MPNPSDISHLAAREEVETPTRPFAEGRYGVMAVLSVAHDDKSVEGEVLIAKLAARLGTPSVFFAMPSLTIQVKPRLRLSRHVVRVITERAVLGVAVSNQPLRRWTLLAAFLETLRTLIVLCLMTRCFQCTLPTIKGATFLPFRDVVLEVSSFHMFLWDIVRPA